jgi:hypothetical protein
LLPAACVNRHHALEFRKLKIARLIPIPIKKRINFLIGIGMRGRWLRQNYTFAATGG